MSLIASEHQEQVSLFQWAEVMQGTYPVLRWMYAVPNGGKRNKITAAALKREGVRPGMLDIVVPCARGGFHGLYIEMKRTKGGTVSKEQKEWLEYLLEAGYLAVVCKGWEEAKEVIERYLNG